MMLDLWYKNAVVYCLDVDSFADSDDNGVGDFLGLTERLDYLQGLGVTCIWLLPFYPSPDRDNGYDVKDYYTVDPRLGTLGDFVEFERQARERGMRIIIDLVVNHTSIEHPWFQAARRDPKSKFRDYYVWSEERPEDYAEGVVFPGVQETTWTYDQRAKAYYFHRFYSHQPDLNIANPAVRDEIRKIMGFWLELGVAGFRIDAAPFLIELNGGTPSDVEDPIEYLTHFRNFLSWRRGDAVLIAEANVAPDEIPRYFGGGDRMHLLFNFFVNQYLFLAMAREDAVPLRKTLRRLPEIHETSQWANFLRNHDELDLGRLTETERAEAFQAFGPEKRMQLYNRGIRRRLPPMLGNDRRRIELGYSLMFTLPGTPVLWYGQEIGLGDDLSLKERNSVRTPMQWSDAKNGGFSEAPRKKLVRPVISGGEYGYQKVNVAQQRGDERSMLGWMERAIRARKECPEIGWGDWTVLQARDPAVIALRYDWRGGVLVALHNLSSKDVSTSLDLDGATRLSDVLADQEYEPLSKNGGASIRLAGYGYRWLHQAAPHPTQP